MFITKRTKCALVVASLLFMVSVGYVSANRSTAARADTAGYRLRCLPFLGLPGFDLIGVTTTGAIDPSPARAGETFRLNRYGVSFLLPDRVVGQLHVFGQTELTGSLQTTIDAEGTTEQHQNEALAFGEVLPEGTSAIVVNATATPPSFTAGPVGTVVLRQNESFRLTINIGSGGGASTTCTVPSGSTTPTDLTIASAPIMPRVGAAIAFVANRGDNSVTPIDTATNQKGQAFPIGATAGENINGIAISGRGTTLFVTVSPNERPGRLIAVDAITHQVLGSANVGVEPDSIAVARNGRTAYVVNHFSDSVTPVAISEGRLSAGPPISVAHNPWSIAITPDGSTAYVTSEAGSPGVVTPIDLATNTTSKPIPVGNRPNPIAISRDGATAYVGNADDNTVSAISLGTRTVFATAGTGSQPDTIVLMPDGRRGYVLNDQGSLTVLDVSGSGLTGSTRMLTAPFWSHGMAGTPDGSSLYITSFFSGITTPVDVRHAGAETLGTPIPVGWVPFGVVIAVPNRPAIDLTMPDPTLPPDPLPTVTTGPIITLPGIPAPPLSYPDPPKLPVPVKPAK